MSDLLYVALKLVKSLYCRCMPPSIAEIELSLVEFNWKLIISWGNAFTLSGSSLKKVLYVERKNIIVSKAIKKILIKNLKFKEIFFKIICAL